MTQVKKGGLIYTRNKIPKFQTGNAFAATEEPKPIAYQFGDANLFSNKPAALSSSLGIMKGPKNFMDGYAKTGSNNFNTGVANQFSAPPTNSFTGGFGNNKFQGAFNKNSTAGMFGKQAASTTVTGAARGFQMPKMDAAAGVGIAGAAIGMLGSAIGKGDNDAATFTKKEKRGVLLGSTLKGVGTGASLGTTFIPIPVLGTAIGAGVGAIVGVISGLFKSKKMKKEAKTLTEEQDKQFATAASAKRRSDIAGMDASMALSTPTTGVTQDANLTGYMSRKTGGSFHYKVKPSFSPSRLRVLTPELPKKFKRGGSITATENIIPNGVLHEEFNKLGDKGMPVVKCKNNSCEKKYEIEKDEMIFTLEATKSVEKLVKSGDLKKLGEYVRSQVLDNTHSFTDKFNDLNTYNKNKDESIFA
jgi:hypothetical protein